MKIAHLALAAVLTASPFTATVAQTVYPTKPVKIIVPFSAGGIVDSVARLVGDRLSTMNGQPSSLKTRQVPVAQ